MDKIPSGLMAAMSELTGISYTLIQKYFIGRKNPSEKNAAVLAAASAAIGIRVTPKMWRDSQKNWRRIRRNARRLKIINVERAWARLNGDPWPPLRFDYWAKPRKWDCYRYAECLDAAARQDLIMDCQGCDDYRPGDPGWVEGENIACGRLLNRIFFQDEQEKS